MIRLNAVEFEGQPTPSQIANVCEEMWAFINKMMGTVMASGDAVATDPKVGSVLNAAGLLKGAADQWRGSSGIAQPTLVPRPVGMQPPQG